MKAMRSVIASNGVPYLQMMSKNFKSETENTVVLTVPMNRINQMSWKVISRLLFIEIRPSDGYVKPDDPLGAI